MKSIAHLGGYAMTINIRPMSLFLILAAVVLVAFARKQPAVAVPASVPAPAPAKVVKRDFPPFPARPTTVKTKHAGKDIGDHMREVARQVAPLYGVEVAQ